VTPASSFLAAFASYPVIVLFTSSWIVVALGYGAFSLKVTTDPVELWASPQSRSRIEKDYFDSRFEPFFRTEQVFVKTVGIDKVGTSERTGVMAYVRGAAADSGHTRITVWFNGEYVSL